jgi:uncharacterized membrane protein YczE
VSRPAGFWARPLLYLKTGKAVTKMIYAMIVLICIGYGMKLAVTAGIGAMRRA